MVNRFCKMILLILVFYFQWVLISSAAIDEYQRSSPVEIENGLFVRTSGGAFLEKQFIFKNSSKDGSAIDVLFDLRLTYNDSKISFSNLSFDSALLYSTPNYIDIDIQGALIKDNPSKSLHFVLPKNKTITIRNLVTSITHDMPDYPFKNVKIYVRLTTPFVKKTVLLEEVFLNIIEPLIVDEVISLIQNKMGIQYGSKTTIILDFLKEIISKSVVYCISNLYTYKDNSETIDFLDYIALQIPVVLLEKIDVKHLFTKSRLSISLNDYLSHFLESVLKYYLKQQYTLGVDPLNLFMNSQMDVTDEFDDNLIQLCMDIVKSDFVINTIYKHFGISDAKAFKLKILGYEIKYLSAISQNIYWATKFYAMMNQVPEILDQEIQFKVNSNFQWELTPQANENINILVTQNKSPDVTELQQLLSYDPDVSLNFIDVPENIWYYNYLNILYQAGFVIGDINPETNLPAGTFRPSDNITRAEFTKLLVLMSNHYPTSTLLTSDQQAVFNSVPENHWARPFIRAALSTEIAMGYNDNSFGEDLPVKRSETAKMIVNAFRLEMLETENSPLSFVDVDHSDWFRPYVDICSKLGVNIGYSDKTFKPGDPITRAESVKLLYLALLRSFYPSMTLPQNLYDYKFQTKYDQPDTTQPEVTHIALNQSNYFAGDPIIIEFSAHDDRNIHHAGFEIWSADKTKAIYILNGYNEINQTSIHSTVNYLVPDVIPPGQYRIKVWLADSNDQQDVRNHALFSEPFTIQQKDDDQVIPWRGELPTTNGSDIPYPDSTVRIESGSFSFDYRPTFTSSSEFAFNLKTQEQLSKEFTFRFDFNASDLQLTENIKHEPSVQDTDGDGIFDLNDRNPFTVLTTNKFDETGQLVNVLSDVNVWGTVDPNDSNLLNKDSNISTGWIGAPRASDLSGVRIISDPVKLDTCVKKEGSKTFSFDLQMQFDVSNTFSFDFRPDTDNDGIIDVYDKFPNDPAASIDDDNDGFPDQWNKNASEEQIQNSNLTIDSFVPLNNSTPKLTHFTKEINEDNILHFSLSDFSNAFEDIDNDTLVHIKITTLPANGELRLNDDLIELNDQINADTIDLLLFKPDENWNGLTTFSWNGFDSKAYASEPEKVPITVHPVNDIPVISLPGPDIILNTENVSIFLDKTSKVDDCDSQNFDSGYLVVNITENADKEDRVFINNEGTENGQIFLDGNNVYYTIDSNNINIARFTGGSDGFTPLIVYFNDKADLASVESIMRNIRYENTSANPKTGDREVRQIINDGDNGVSDEVYKKVTVRNAQNPSDVCNYEEIKGNPVSPVWTIFLEGVQLYNKDIGMNGVIYVYDGELQVGSFAITREINESNRFENILTVWSSLNSGEGYQSGHSYKFACCASGKFYENFEIIFNETYSEAYAGKYFPEGDGHYSIAKINFINSPPIIKGSPKTDINENDEYLFIPYATDVDGDPLIFSIINKPDWSEFNQDSGELSGTPLNEHVGLYENIVIKVTDTSDQSASLTPFNIMVVNVNNPPILVNPIPDQTIDEDLELKFTFDASTFKDIDAVDSLTYTAKQDDSVLPDWLNFDAASRTFSGTPTNDDVGILSITVIATDNSKASVSDNFTLTVRNTNDPPILVKPIPDQRIDEDSELKFTFDASTFKDIDVGDSLTYTAKQGDSVLPDWLSFNAVTRTFSGTPVNDDVGNLSITVIATDQSYSSVSDNFTLTVVNTNDQPILVNPIPDQTIDEDSELKFTFDASTFKDIDVGDSLTYTAKQDDSALPDWLSFNAVTRTFSGTPVNDDVGNLSITVIATDNSNASVSDNFTLTVVNTNDPPILVNPIPDQTIDEDSELKFAFDASTFKDIDIGDSLTYTAKHDDSALPDWLSFSAVTRTFSGTPVNENAGNLSITVIATDQSYSSVSDTFTLTVVNTNDPPILVKPIPDQRIDENSKLIFAFDSLTFKDIDVGDSLTYTAKHDDSALPDWLSFNAVTRTFSGTPTNDDVGISSITVIATDQSYSSVSDIFTLTVINTNDPPILVNPIQDQRIDEDSELKFTFDASTYKDIDVGDSLSYTAKQDDSVLPDWLNFDAATRTFSGTPTNDDVGTLNITVIATDQSYSSISDNFALTVINTNDPPILVKPIPDQTIDEDLKLIFAFDALTFKDIDVGDLLTYTAKQGNSVLPDWLSFNTATRTFSGTPTNDDVGTLNITVIATDQSYSSVSDSFTLTVRNTNDPPILVNPIPDQTIDEDLELKFTFDASTFKDIDVGDSLTYTAKHDDSALPDWLSFSAVTRTFSGTPVNENAGNLSITVIATDQSYSSVSDTFTLTVVNTNDPPILVKPIPDQRIDENSKLIFAFDSLTFKDIDVGDSLTYTAKHDDSALPDWLSFNAVTRTFSGTPTNDDVGISSITVIATDQSYSSVSDIFTLTVINTNDPPILVNPIQDQRIDEDSELKFTFDASTYKDIDVGDSLSYTAKQDDSVLPDWLNFDAATRTFSGTPTNDDVGTLNITVIATDQSYSSISDNFALTVINTNDPPILVKPIPDQTIDEDLKLIFAFDALTFKDIDVGDLLTYTAKQGNSVLPDWLSFNTATRTFSGTPTNDDVGTLNITVIATDQSYSSVSDSFTLTVRNTNDPPILVNPIPDQTIDEDLELKFTFDASTFKDIDVGDSLTYTAKHDDSALPDWLSFSAVTRTFSGTPTNDDVGNLSITVIATDQSYSSVSDNFTLTVINTNDPPILVKPIPDQTIDEDSELKFTFDASTFKDIDVGDSLTYTAKQGDSVLPDCLNFDAATRTFFGTPTNDDVGNLSITVIATDQSYSSVSDNFTLTVINTNDPPILVKPIPDQTIDEDSELKFTFDASTFKDIDVGDSLTYTAKQGDSVLPDCLNFDAATRTFFGTPTNDDVGNLSITVIATDQSYSSVSDNFTLTVINTNDPPILVKPIPDQTIDEDSELKFTFDASTFKDIDVGDSLTYTAKQGDSVLPDCLNFDAATRTFFGTPTNDDVGNLSITVIATDQSYSSVSDNFTLTVINTNDPPILVKPIPDQTIDEDSELKFTFDASTFKDIDVGDSLTYTAKQDDSVLPDWLNFDAATRAFSGTPTNDDVGNLSITVIATDQSYSSVSDNFTLTVINTNDPPILVKPIPDQTIDEDSELKFTFDASTFKDIDVGDSLTYTAKQGDSVLPDWLNFDAATRTFSGTPTNDDVGNLSITVIATDQSYSSVSDNFTLTVVNTNDPPILVKPIPDQTIDEDSELKFTFDASTFKDIDVGDSLTYTAKQDDSVLPDWLYFDAATRTFSGTPVNDDVGTLSITVIATDQSYSSVSDSFALKVKPNCQLRLVNPIPDQTIDEDSELKFTLDFLTFVGCDDYSFTYSTKQDDGSALPDWLNFNALTRTFSGTPTNDDVGYLSITVIATDQSYSSVSDIFTLTVINTNDQPILVNPIPDQTIDEDSELKFTFDASTFKDIDVGDSLTYTAKQDDSVLPDWLNFDAATRTFSGTPVNDDVGTLSITVIATDQSYSSVSDSFTLTVVNTNDPPILVNPIPDQTIDEDLELKFTFDASTFKDIDVGDSLTYTAKKDDSVLPDWLNFDAATRTFSGTPTNDDVGNLSITVIATDQSYSSVSDNFTLTVINTNDPPILVKPIPDQTIDEDSELKFTFDASTFKDIDVGDSLTYTAKQDDSVLLDWLNFNAETRTFSGMPENDDVGILSITVIATDNSNASVSDNFTLTVTVTVPSWPPIYIPDQAIDEDSELLFTFDASTFYNDIGVSLSYTAKQNDGSVLPDWLNFNSETRTFSGTPTNYDVGTLSITVTAIATNTSCSNVSGSFTLTVVNTNDPPILVKPIPDQTIDEDSELKFTFDASTFKDIDVGDSLTYTAKQGDSVLPDWLNFDAATRTFSGTPTNDDVGNLSITVIATDTSYSSVSDAFQIKVNKVADINGDNQVDMKDIVLSLQILSGFQEVESTGKVDLTNLIFIILQLSN